MTVMYEEIVEKVKKLDKLGGIISILQEIQVRYGYLPEEALVIVAEQTGSSLVDIYGVATFYKSFTFQPRGKHLVSVCLGTACHVRGAPTIAEEVQKILGIQSGETTADREFTLETVNCLGACALGPIIVVDGHYFSNVTREMVPRIIEKARNGLDSIEVSDAENIFPVSLGCVRCNHSLMEGDYLIDGYPSIKVTISFGGKHGWLRLSSLYGSYNIVSDHEIPEDTVVNFFCPHCHHEFFSTVPCAVCSAPMVPFHIRGGGVVQICSRRGCKNHMLDLQGTVE